MHERTLVCLDGSDLAERIVPYAEEWALPLGGKIILLRIVDMSAAVWDYNCPTVDEARKHAYDEAVLYLERIAESIQNKGLTVDAVVLKITPVGEAIINYARQNEIDLIALATHGHGGLRKMLLGSVAEYVLRESQLPLLLIHP